MPTETSKADRELLEARRVDQHGQHPHLNVPRPHHVVQVQLLQIRRDRAPNLHKPRRLYDEEWFVTAVVGGWFLDGERVGVFDDPFLQVGQVVQPGGLGTPVDAAVAFDFPFFLLG